MLMQFRVVFKKKNTMQEGRNEMLYTKRLISLYHHDCSTDKPMSSLAAFLRK